MTKKFLIVSLAFGLTACATSQAPLDDAYYWPDKPVQNAKSVPTSQNIIAPQIASGTPDIQIINQQDTTVTIRVKR